MAKKEAKALSVITLGTRAYIKEHARFHSNHSGLLIDSSFMFDVGEKKYLRKKPAAIFITHFHPDHAFFVTEDYGPLHCPVYGPELFESRPEIKKLHRSIKAGEFKITPIPTVHSFKYPSQGYLVEGKGKRIFYSGDTITIEKKHLKKIKKVDAVFTEASFFRHGGMIHRFGDKIAGHNGVRELIELFRPHTGRIIFMHFGSWFFENIKESKKRLLGLSDTNLKVEAAKDGKIFYV